MQLIENQGCEKIGFQGVWTNKFLPTAWERIKIEKRFLFPVLGNLEKMIYFDNFFDLLLLSFESLLSDHL